MKALETGQSFVRSDQAQWEISPDRVLSRLSANRVEARLTVLSTPLLANSSTAKIASNEPSHFVI